MKNRFQLGFLLGSLLPLAAICALGHSERVSLAAGVAFLFIPALLWPRRVSGWLLGLGEFYERVTLRPARSGRRQGSVLGPESGRTNASTIHEPANASPTPESARRRQNMSDPVISALVNFGCPKSKARAIAEQVGPGTEQERVFAAMRMVRA